MCITDNPVKAKKPQNKAEALQLQTIRKSLPEHLFEKRLLNSMFYLCFDYFMWLGSMAVLYALINSNIWSTLTFWEQSAVSLVYWNFAGFFMWCLFVVGHDCGHGTFSNYEWLNDIVGHITHGSIMVPFWPWQLSHRRHHMYHNHETKDYSHAWYTEERKIHPDEGRYRFMEKYPVVKTTFPFFGWFLYLYGLPDGSHYLPYSSQRMWLESPKVERYKCVFSSFILVLYALFILEFCDYNISSIVYYYGVPLVVFGWWLVTVTYLQHHNHHTKVYQDDTWKFVDAAFETIDRTYGSAVDTLSHNITDGHVVHHLFFTKIPHYNLAEATAHLQDYLEENGLKSIYQHENTYDFFIRAHQYFYSIGFNAVRADTTISKKLE